MLNKKLNITNESKRIFTVFRFHMINETKMSSQTRDFRRRLKKIVNDVSTLQLSFEEAQTEFEILLRDLTSLPPIPCNIRIELACVYNFVVVANPKPGKNVLHIFEKSLVRCVEMLNPRISVSSSTSTQWTCITYLLRQIVDSRLGSTELTLLLAAATAQILWSGDIQGVQDLQPFAQLIQLLDKQMKEERMEVEEEKDEKDEENEEEGNFENEINELKVLNIFYPAQLVGIQHVHLTAQLNFITLKLLRGQNVSLGEVKALSEVPDLANLRKLFEAMKGVINKEKRKLKGEDAPLTTMMNKVGFTLKGLEKLNTDSEQDWIQVLYLCSKAFSVDDRNTKRELNAIQSQNNSCVPQILNIIIRVLKSSNQSSLGYLNSLQNLLNFHGLKSCLQIQVILAQTLLLEKRYQEASAVYLHTLSGLRGLEDKDGSLEPGIDIEDLRLGAVLSLLLEENPCECLVILNYLENLIQSRVDSSAAVDSSFFCFYFASKAYSLFKQFPKALMYIERAEKEMCPILTQKPQKNNDQDDSSLRFQHRACIQSRVYFEKSQILGAQNLHVQALQNLECALRIHPNTIMYNQYLSELKKLENMGLLTAKDALKKKKVGQLESRVKLEDPFPSWSLGVPGEHTNYSICLRYILDLDTLELENRQTIRSVSDIF
ncbi:uncharacterized protein LOC111712812 isoform X2 [Eurytemora carolleeae]|uniref:uncharacterized protein LOC111712812 isoform X1 n=1 Tax=Eurytemora carolleeae TaxID=1294199 RepID=UPI000C772E39|nr:uncharacterized protein LOC111712812 isoform X1 [Eurytemora carolleeae]XP_023343308.1 uncharacterized protein LOC111712812 isoform X2 [Eurytemora carolleeae]|eukprot:XP_023343307.1 uncharacterized protein LOC111712812 isoform X1 [Eurytemora affinis]